MVDTGNLRDAAMFMAIFGFFASVWFGWSQDSPPPAWVRWLRVATILGLLVSLVGGLLAWRSWDAPSALRDADTFRVYTITVTVEFWAAAVGAVVLALRRRKKWIPVWICAVVGVHFVPLAVVFDSYLLIALALVLVAVAFAALRVDRQRQVEPSAVTGAGAGSALLVSALIFGAVAVAG